MFEKSYRVNADGYKCLVQSGEAKLGLNTCPIGIIHFGGINPADMCKIIGRYADCKKRKWYTGKIESHIQ